MLSCVLCKTSWTLQGLSEDYFAQYKRYTRLSQQIVPAQSLEEIDGLLKEAGLRVSESD